MTVVNGDGVRRWLRVYQARLRRERDQPRHNQMMVAAYADALARCYDWLGQPAAARDHFRSAATAKAIYIVDYLGGETLYSTERGDLYSEVGRMLWRAGDLRAAGYFDFACRVYQGVFSNRRSSLWASSLVGAIYCHWFLEEWAAARAVATDLCNRIETSGERDRLQLSSLIDRVATNFVTDTAAAHRHTLTLLDRYFIRFERDQLARDSGALTSRQPGLHPIPLVDVYELARCRASRRGVGSG